MSQESTLKDEVQNFLNGLRRHCGARPDDLPSNPGIRAALRRGASQGTRYLAFQAVRQCGGHLSRFNGDPDPSWVAVGSAFAFYPQPPVTKDWCFGSTCRELAKATRQKDKNGKDVSSFDTRFRRVLGAESAADLAKWVVQIARRARTAKPRPAPLNYEELLYSMLRWDAADRSVRERIRARWASAYWDDRPTDDNESEDL